MDLTGGHDPLLLQQLCTRSGGHMRPPEGGAGDRISGRQEDPAPHSLHLGEPQAGREGGGS